MPEDVLLFSLDVGNSLFVAVANELHAPIAPHEERVFDDGEFKVRPLLNPTGRTAVVMQSLHGAAGLSPHDRLLRLWMFAATLRDHGASGVIAVVPYLAYARKDRRTKPFDPLSLKYLARHVECAGIDGLIALEVHEPGAFENAFRIPVRNVPASPVFDGLIDDPLDHWVIASPDPGGVKRAQLWRESLQTLRGMATGLAFLDKRRSAGVLSGEDLLAGSVRDARVLLYDDLIVSGETLLRAARRLRAGGAREVHAVAAHGLFNAQAGATLNDPALTGLVVTDSIADASKRIRPAKDATAPACRVLSAASLLATAIGSVLGR